MWPLLLCSLLGLAAILDRLWAYSTVRINFDQFVLKLKTELSSQKTLVLPAWVNSLKAPPAKLAVIFFNYLNHEQRIRDEALKREGNKLLSLLADRMRLLSAIATVAPLLGLLGTVAGLVQAFHMIELKGGVIQPSDLAGGIWSALITTVAGLCVGIPALLMHNYFQGLSETTSQQMEEVVSELDEIVALKNQPLVAEPQMAIPKPKEVRAYGN